MIPVHFPGRQRSTVGCEGSTGGCHAETRTVGVGMTFGSLLLTMVKKLNLTCVFLTSTEWPAFIGSTMDVTQGGACMGQELRGEGERRDVSLFLAAVC